MTYIYVMVHNLKYFQNVFRAHQNAKPVFSHSSGLKSVFEKLLSGGPIVWISVDGRGPDCRCRRFLISLA